MLDDAQYAWFAVPKCWHNTGVLQRIILNMTLLLHVVNESENVVVNQVVEEVNPSIEVGFDICGTTPEPDFSDNQGKPWMHLNLPCVLQIYIIFY